MTCQTEIGFQFLTFFIIDELSPKTPMKPFAFFTLLGLLPCYTFAQLPMGADLYQQLCVECHGARLEGNKAAPLIKEKLALRA